MFTREIGSNAKENKAIPNRKYPYFVNYLTIFFYFYVQNICVYF